MLDNPGRMYMILAAQRLAALIAMIRDFDANEAVTLVAHSQGCMLSLLAQAFLMENGSRPADTLILNNPPYSLVDDIPTLTKVVEGGSGKDPKMLPWYGSLNGRQTLHARLQTLVNIVHGVIGKKHSTPAFTSLNDQCVHHGMVSGLWKAAADRDNRGKVYLYFCPEDMTVALNNVQGIGWQGVPDFQHGNRVKQVPETKRDLDTRQIYKTGRMEGVLDSIVRQPMKELTALNANGAGFFQRVFTNKLRPDPRTGTPVLVGQVPHDFVLRTKDEDDQGHTGVSDSIVSKHIVRARLPKPATSLLGTVTPEEARLHIRAINGERLPVEAKASLNEGAQADARGRAGGSEEYDPIDAAVAITSDYGLMDIWEIHPYPTERGQGEAQSGIKRSPNILAYDGFVVVSAAIKVDKFRSSLNQGKSEGQQTEILEVFDCMGTSATLARYAGKVLVHRTETPDHARLRWQNSRGARSFHGAIFGGTENHRRVTAYDVAIGGGKAVTNPLFYQYLCAVADWRLKDADDNIPRPSIRKLAAFEEDFHIYWKDEPQWRVDLIKGNSHYYSTGILPDCVPALMEGLPSSVVCETLTCVSLPRPTSKPAVAPGNPTKENKGRV